MTWQDLVSKGFELLSNPLFWLIASTLLTAAAREWFKANKAARDTAQKLANYNAKVIEFMVAMEATGAPGPVKWSGFLKKLDAWLDEVGVDGDAKAVTLESALEDVKILLPLVDLKKRPALPPAA